MDFLTFVASAPVGSEAAAPCVGLIIYVAVPFSFSSLLFSHLIGL